MRRLPPALDVPSPGQSLVANSQAAGRGALAEQSKIIGESIDIAGRFPMDAAADEQQIRAQAVHHIKLGFCPIERARPKLTRESFEVAKGLIASTHQAEVGNHSADICCCPVKSQQVVFENLDTAITRRRDGGKLPIQGTADRDRSN